MKYKLGDLTVKRWNDWDNVPRHPQFVIPAIQTALGVGAVTATIIYAVGATLVMSFVMKALAPKPDFGALAQQGLLANTRTATAAQQIVYGEVRKGGVITFLESTGDDNEYLHMVIALAGHEVNSIGDIYINDEVVTLDGNGFVTDSKWLDADSNKMIKVIKKTGADNQTAITDLVNDTSVTSDFKGQGVAYLYIRMEYDQTVFAEGIPLFTAKVQGKKVYDPRTSTTAYSANAALCIRDFLNNEYYGLDDGNSINDTMFSAAANTCDETVSLADGGTEKRYEINGVSSMDQAPQEILADMMTACAGTLFWGQGQWQLKVGEYTSSVKTFTLDDLRSPIQLATKHSRRDNFNIVRGTFNDAGQNWIRADYPEIRSSAFITNDNGYESPLDLTLPFTTSSTMAQRLAKMTLFRSREQMTFTAEFGLEALEVQAGDIIALTIDRYGWSAKEFEVVGWQFSNNSEQGDLRVALTLRETSSAAFSWSAEESDITGNNTTLTTGAANLAINNLVASGGGSTQGDGTFINSVILSWDQPTNRFVSYFEVDWKPTADSNYASTTSPDNSIELSPLIDGVQYTFRVRAVTANGYRGAYATVTFTGGGDTTAPALPTSISATGGFKYITIDWTNPADSDLNFVEVYENTTNTSSGATLVGVSAGSSFTRSDLGLSQTRYYFLKSVDYSGNKSAFTSGVSATTTFLDDGDFENGVRQIFIDAGLDVIEPVSSLPASGDFNGQQVFLTTDSKLYFWDGSQWDTVVAATADVAFTDLQGSIAASQIPSDVITEAKIADDAITAGKISANAVGANAIAANSISGDKIVANTITSGLLATSGLITNSAQITNGLITNALIANGAIDNAKIANATIDKAKIASIDAATITAGTINVTYLPGLTFSDVVTGGDAGTSTSRFNTQSTAITTSAIRTAMGMNGSPQTTFRYNNYASLSGVSSGSTLIATATLTIEKNSGSDPSGMNTCYFVLHSGSTAIASPLTNVTQKAAVTLESTNHVATFTAALAIESAASGTATMGFYFSGGSPDEDEMSADAYSFSVIEFTK